MIRWSLAVGQAINSSLIIYRSENDIIHMFLTGLGDIIYLVGKVNTMNIMNTSCFLFLQGEVQLSHPRLHVDIPVVMCEALMTAR